MQGKIVKSDTTDGYVTIKKRPKGIFEMRVYFTGEETPVIFNGTLSNLLATMNKYKDYYMEI